MKMSDAVGADAPLVLAGAYRAISACTDEGDHFTPIKIIKAHSPGEDVCCLNFNDVLLVSGSSSGSLKLFNLEILELVGNLSMGSVAYNCIKIKGGMVIAAAGQKVTVQVCKNLEEKLEVGLRLQFIYRSLDLFNLFATRF